MQDRFRDDLVDNSDRAFLYGAALLLMFFAAVSSLMTPLYRGPDETQHVDMVIHVFENLDWPDPGDRFVDLALRASKSKSLWSLRSSRREMSDATPRMARDSWNEIERTVEGRPTDTGGRNPASQHPFLYYSVLALPWGILQASVLGFAHDQVASLLRLMNVVLLFPVPFFLMAAGRAAELPRRVTRLGVLFLLFIPQFTHIFGLVNNDNLLILGGSILTYFLIRVVRGDGSFFAASALGLTFGFMSLVKGIALFWAPVILVAYVWGLQSSSRRWDFGQSAVLASLAGMGAGGWWWVRNVVVYGRVQPRVLENPVEGNTLQEGMGPWAEAFLVRFVDGFWGRFGTLDAPMHRWLTTALWIILVILIVSAFFIVANSEDKGRRRAYLVLVLPFIVIAVLIVMQSLASYVQSGWAAGMQGRYLFSAICGVSLAAALALDRMVRVREGWVWMLGVTLQMYAILVMLYSWWGPREEVWTLRLAIEAWFSWLPWSPVFVFGVAGIWLGAIVTFGIRDQAVNSVDGERTVHQTD